MYLQGTQNGRTADPATRLAGCRTAEQAARLVKLPDRAPAAPRSAHIAVVGQRRDHPPASLSPSWLLATREDIPRVDRNKTQQALACLRLENKKYHKFIYLQNVFNTVLLLFRDMLIESDQIN